MRRFVSLWPAALSAILVLAAFPPVSFGLLTLVGLGPFFAALWKASSRRALALGYLFGFTYMLVQVAWLEALVGRWTNNHWLALFTWLLAGFLGAWYFALFGWLANRCFKRNWPWMVPLVWAGIEVFRSYIPGLAFPWGLLADPLWSIPPIIQTAYFGSIYLMSAWCALGGLMVAQWLTGAGWRQIRPYAAAFVFALALSLVRFSIPLPSKAMSVTAGQLGVDMAFGNPATQEQDIQKNATLLTYDALAQRSDLLVLPEGISDQSKNFPPHPSFLIVAEMPVIFGGQRWTEKGIYQTAYSYDGQKWQYADKNRLVIFGEYVPLRNWLPFLSAFQLPTGDLTPGDRLSTLDIRGTKVGPLICFEELFPDLAYRQAQNGAQLLAIVSIDDWYMGTSAPEQLKSAAVWRSVETDLPLVRSASLGYTLAVDQRGRIQQEAPLGKLIPLHAELRIPDKPDPFPLYPIFPYLTLASLIGAFLAPWLPKKTNSERPKNP